MKAPVFAHGHLRLYLLSLLATEPMHGYELIHALETRFGGTYIPSAGTIYPRLAKLEDEGLVTKTTDGRKTVYAITDAGRAELDARQSELDGIESDVTDSVRRLADEVRSSVNSAMRSLRADLAASAREARRGDASSRTQRVHRAHRHGARGEQRAVAGGGDGAQRVPAPGAHGSAHAWRRAGRCPRRPLPSSKSSWPRCGPVCAARPRRQPPGRARVPRERWVSGPGWLPRHHGRPERHRSGLDGGPGVLTRGPNRCSVAPRD